MVYMADDIVEPDISIQLRRPPFSRNDEVIKLYDFHDNISHQCSGYDGSFVNCSDEISLWWRMLQWLKVMLLKIARSYSGKPFMLFLPLLVGLCLGYILGRRHQDSQAKKRRKTLSITFDWISAIAFYICLMVTPAPPPSARIINKLAPVQKNDTNNSLNALPKDLASEKRENIVRSKLMSDADTCSESGVDANHVPRHIAVIMDGNRRYGKKKYGNESQGHWDGSSKLVEFAKWCIAEHVSVLTVFAFSTENWNRDPTEIASLMKIFAKYCDELRVEALKRDIKINVLSTDSTRIPSNVRNGLQRMVEETKHCNGLTMNICMSYGSRGEIVAAARSLAEDVYLGDLKIDSIDEDTFQQKLLTSHSGDPDVLIRTSGEIRISNFLLWQLAYCEMFFLDKPWPAVEKKDLIEIIQAYAGGRIRRYGK